MLLHQTRQIFPPYSYLILTTELLSAFRLPSSLSLVYTRYYTVLSILQESHLGKPPPSPTPILHLHIQNIHQSAVAAGADACARNHAFVLIKVLGLCEPKYRDFGGRNTCAAFFISFSFAETARAGRSIPQVGEKTSQGRSFVDADCGEIKKQSAEVSAGYLRAEQ